MNKKTSIIWKGLITFSFVFLLYGLNLAQTNDIQVVAAGGGFSETSQLSMSYTIGEISISTQNNGSYLITQGFQQSFSLFSSLPVELLSFAVRKIAKTTKLTWQTSSERNNKGFEIERSTNGIDWKEIGFVQGYGDSYSTKDYSFLDLAPYDGNNYYRLKQIDIDGQFEFSPIRHLFFTQDSNATLSVFPNPNSGQFTISIKNPLRQRAILKLFSSSGSLIWSQNFSQGEMPEYWESEFILDQQEMYFIVSQVGEEITSEKIVVIKRG